MPLTAVTFDFHNTLAECDEWFQIEVRELVPRFLDWYSAHHDVTIDDEERIAAVTHYRALRLAIMDHGDERDAYECTADVLELLGRTVEPSTIRRGVDEIMSRAVPDSSPVPGVVDAVRYLQQRGIKLAVVSSAVHHGFLEWSLEQFGILDCFSHVVTSASCGFYKSRTEIYEHALNLLDVAATEAVHIGDSYRFDVETASRAGMRTVWFSRSQVEERANGAGLTLESLEGLAPLVIEHFGSGR